MAKTTAPVQNLSYEEAVAELERLLSDLEDESKNLEATLALFERGRALIARCQDLLDKAELKVRQLTASGEIVDLEEQD